MAVFMAVNAIILRFMNLSVRDYVSGLTFPNAGNAGLSLSLFAYGQPGLALGIIYFAVCSLSNFTVGQSILAGRGNLGAVLRSPMIWAVLIGIAGNLLQIHPPLWIMRSLQVGGGIAIPLMLFTLGVSLATLKVNDLKRGLLLSALRLAIGMVAGFGLSWLLGLEGVARGVFIIQCAMPVAVVNYIFAVRYNRDPQTKQLLLSGQGQSHIEVTVAKLKRRFGVEVTLKLPRIPYRETIKASVEAHGRHKKQTGGHGQFGDCKIRVAPLPRGSDFAAQVTRHGGGWVPADLVSTSKPASVTATVCSHCAERLWSLVTMVQPSASSRIPALPALIIGSMVKVMPGSSSRPAPARP